MCLVEHRNKFTLTLVTQNKAKVHQPYVKTIRFVAFDLPVRLLSHAEL
jgi:hypothetical protein